MVVSRSACRRLRFHEYDFVFPAALRTLVVDADSEELLQPGVLEGRQEHPAVAEPAIERNLDGAVVGVVCRTIRIGEEPFGRRPRRHRVERQLGIVRVAEDPVRPAIGHLHGNSLSVHARAIDLLPLVSHVLVDVREACGEPFTQLLLEVRRELVAIRALEVRIDRDEAAAALRRDEVAQLLRLVQQPIAIQVALRGSGGSARHELIAQLGEPDRVLIVGNDVGRIEVEAAEETLHDRLAVAAEVVGERLRGGRTSSTSTPSRRGSARGEEIDDRWSVVPVSCGRPSGSKFCSGQPSV